MAKVVIGVDPHKRMHAGGSQTTPDEPPAHHGNCQNMGGQTPGATAPSQGTGASQTGFQHGGYGGPRY